MCVHFTKIESPRDLVVEVKFASLLPKVIFDTVFTPVPIHEYIVLGLEFQPNQPRTPSPAFKNSILSKNIN